MRIIISNYRISVKDNNGIEMLTTDENIRPDTDLKGLSGLMPAFEMIGGMGGFNEVALDKYLKLKKLIMFIMQVTHQRLLTGLQLL